MLSRILTGSNATGASLLLMEQVDRGAGLRARSRANPQGPAPPAEELGRLEQFQAERLEEARREGARAGEAAGRKQAAQELRPVVENLAKAIREIESLRPGLRSQAEGDVVKLALAIARRILHREVSVDPEALRGLVQSALSRIGANEIVRVRAHPGQIPMLRACLQASGSGAGPEILPEPAFAAGSVVVETVRGDLDLTLDAQLMEIERGLTDVLRSRS